MYIKEAIHSFLSKGFVMKKTSLLIASFMLFSSCFSVGEDETITSIDEHKFWGLSSFFSVSPADVAKKLIKETYPVDMPHQPVHVQSSISLSNSEKNFLHHRMNKAQQVLQASFGIEQPLRLGFCCSGGGNRAMIGTLGLLSAAAKTKILDASLYLAGLSGSTWLISQLSYLAATSYKYRSLEEILHDIKNDYKKRLSDYSMININGMFGPPLLSFESTDDIFVDIAKRFAYNQEITLVNLFGSLVGDYALGLMGRDRLSEKWSCIADESEHGTIPLPLCSAIFERPGLSFFKPSYEWFEMSPLQCGGRELGYIPVEYLGSGFYNGSLDYNQMCHEYPIGYFLGMYGSAFAVTIQEIGHLQKQLRKCPTILKDDVIEQLQKKSLFNNSLVQGFVHNIIEDVIMSRNSLTYSHFANFSQGMHNSVLKDQESLGLFDAGIAIDLPAPALLDRPERNLDLVIMYDSHNGNAHVFNQIEDYCKEKGLKFPDVSHLNDYILSSQDMTIINDPRDESYDKESATYIYIPTNNIDVKNPPYTTFNFKYTAHDIEELSSKIENVFMSSFDEIKEIMRLVAVKRHV